MRFMRIVYIRRNFSKTAILLLPSAAKKIMGEGRDRKYPVISSIAEDSFYSISSLRYWVYLMDVSEICKDREETLMGKHS